MKTLKAFLCLGIQQAISIVSVLLFLASGCVWVTESPTDYFISESTIDLPAHMTTNWGILAVSDTLFCYAIEYADSSNSFQAFFHQSVNEGKDWSFLGRIALKSNPAFPHFCYNKGKALFAYDDFSVDLEGIYHTVYISPDGCCNWTMIKDGVGKLQGACLFNEGQISLLQATLPQYTTAYSNDFGQHWVYSQKDTRFNSSSRILLADDSVIYSDNGAVVRKAILSDKSDTLFVSNLDYGIDDLIADNTVIGFSDNCKKSVILRNREIVPFSPKKWRSSYRIPTFISDQGEMLFVSVRNLSMTKPKCKTYVIYGDGWKYIELCEGRINSAYGNKAYMISCDYPQKAFRLKCYTVNWRNKQ